MFIGEFSHSLDAKGRIIIPSKMREQLGDTFIMTKGIDECLFAFPLEEWGKIESKLKSLPITSKDARAFTRFFFSGANHVELDKQGRALIPSPLLAFAKLQKECMIVGVSNRVEIWNREKWHAYIEESEEDMGTLVEQLVDFSF